MIILKHNGEVIQTQKPVEFAQHGIPGTKHHRRYLVYWPVPVKGEKRNRWSLPLEIAVKEVRGVYVRLPKK